MTRDRAKIIALFPRSSTSDFLRSNDNNTIQYKFYCQLPMGAFQIQVLIVQVIKKKKKKKKTRQVSQIDYQ